MYTATLTAPTDDMPDPDDQGLWTAVAAIASAAAAGASAWFTARARRSEKALQANSRTEELLYQRVVALEARLTEQDVRAEEFRESAISRETDLRERIAELEHALFSTQAKLGELQQDYDAQSIEVADLRRKNRLLDGQNRTLQHEITELQGRVGRISTPVPPQKK